MPAHERLADWIRSLPVSQTAAAARLGVSAAHLSRIAGGRQTPGLALALAIERETATWREGPIRPSEWLDDDAAPGAPQEATG